MIPFYSALPSTTLIFTTTNTSITMTWTQPLFTPQIYQGYRLCRRQCEQNFGSSIPLYSISSPYTFTGINPGTYCIVGLNGIYGSEPASLDIRITTTLSSGKLCYILIFTIIILFSYYLQYPLHMSIISLFYQLRQGPWQSRGMRYLALDRMDPSLVTCSTTLTQHSVTLLTSLEETVDSTTSQHSHLTLTTL